jgi:uncharacterized membrane protein
MTTMTTKNIDSVPAPAKPDGRTAGSWWPSTWLALLVLLVIAFIAFSVPPYLTLDPGRSRIPPPPDLPAYYPLLAGHVIFASIAMLTVCLQIWPWFRRSYPAAHRMLGRVYVLVGVLPAGIAGLAIGSVSPFGPTIRVSNVLLAVLWLACTTAGFRMGQRRRFAEHRRWMIRSVALTMSIMTNRLWGVIFTIILTPQLSTTFGGNETLMVQTIAGLSGWLGWVLPLLVAEWWLVERVPTAAALARPATLQV